MNIAVRHVRSQPRLVSKAFRSYLDDPAFVFGKNGKKYSRSELTVLTESPCMRAAQLLATAMLVYDIATTLQLYNVGLSGLLRCRGIGERAAWVAACVLGDSGYNVIKWCDMKSQGTRTVRGSIRTAQLRTQKQKHG